MLPIMNQEARIQNFTIKDLETLSGIKSHTIRMWEKRHQFLQPERSDSNIRYYTLAELKHLLTTALLNKYGYRISAIVRMEEAERNQRTEAIFLTNAQTDRAVNELLLLMLEADMDQFEYLLNQYIGKLGIETVVLEIIFPFLERCRGLRRSIYNNPVREYMLTNIIRQKIISGIEHLMPNKKRRETALLFLPQGQFAELTLLSIFFFLKREGYKVIYLGANVQIKNVELLSTQKDPALIVTCLNKNTQAIAGHLVDYLQQQGLSSKLLIAGRQQDHLLQTFLQLRYITHAREVLEHTAEPVAIENMA